MKLGNWKRGVCISTAFLMMLALAGCGGSSTTASGGGAPVSMTIKVVDSAPLASLVKSIDAADATGGVVTVSLARAAIDRVELELPSGVSCSEVGSELEGCSCNDSTSSPDVASSSSPDSSDENELFFAGPLVVDLMTGVSTPSLESLAIPAGTYHSLQLKLKPLDPASTLVPEGDLLLGNSMVIEASYDTAGMATRQFRILLSVDHEIQFESDAVGLMISDASAINALILGLDVNSWFAGIDVGACLDSGAAAQDANGVYVIDAQVGNDACSFLGTLKDAIESSSHFTETSDDSSE